MKLVLNALLVIIVLITLCSCNNENTTEFFTEDTVENTVSSDSNVINENAISDSEQKTNDIDNVTMELISVDNVSAKVKIYNNLEKEIDVEGNFEIQIQTDDGWSNLPYVDDNFGGFLGHANPIGSNFSQEFNVMWEDYYGKLAAGRYRITNFFLLADKNGNYAFSEKYYLYSEFEIIDENTALDALEIYKHKFDLLNEKYGTDFQIATFDMTESELNDLLAGYLNMTDEEFEEYFVDMKEKSERFLKEQSEGHFTYSNNDGYSIDDMLREDGEIVTYVTYKELELIY